MTNRRCTECHGRGYKNVAASAGGYGVTFSPTVLQICDAPYKSGVCTPRTNFRPFEQAAGDHRATAGQIRLPSDKRRDAREANAAQKEDKPKGGFGGR